MTEPSTHAPRWVVHPLSWRRRSCSRSPANQVEPPGSVRPLLVAVAAAAALTAVPWGLTRDRWLGGLIGGIIPRQPLLPAAGSGLGDRPREHRASGAVAILGVGRDFALSRDRFFVSCGTRLLLDLVDMKDPDASPSP